MTHPFPGMDPYIETSRNWPDFHSDLAGEIRAALNTQIQPAYYATTIVYTTYDVVEITQSSKRRSISPDVSIWQTERKTGGINAAALIDPAPVQSQVKMEVPIRIANVEVRKAESDTLITAIEILSPVNKRPGPDRDSYLRKRRELLRSEVHVIEIDLLRAGERSPLEIAPPDAPYYISLAHNDYRPTIDVWPVQLNERLPVIPIPLAYPDPYVPLDLSAIVQRVYERGAYGTRLDYTQPVPPPALNEAQQKYVDDLLAAYLQEE